MSEKIAEGAFGRLLRFWRQVRKRSQEDVALEIDSSIRHISFLENGKSLPSREITLHWRPISASADGKPTIYWWRQATRRWSLGH